MKKPNNISKYPMVSVVIATYNSATVLPRVLDALRRQDYPREKVEILVIDGGSKDGTKNIARKYGCIVLDNPKVFPAWAKYLGFIHSHGEYLMYLDSDEVLIHADSLSRKISAFRNTSSVRAVMGSGYQSPKNFPFVNQYINEFGDPFSFYYYRLSKDTRFFIQTMNTRYASEKSMARESIFIFTRYEQLPIIEVVAMGTVIDRKYVVKEFPKIRQSPAILPHLFYLLILRRASIAIIHDDPIIHYSAATVRGYLSKIRSRVVSNIFTPGEEGFGGRETMGNNSVWKKYLFIPYALTLILPTIDAVMLVSSRKNIQYMLHVPLSVYTALLIVYCSILKLIGIKPVNTSYGS